MKAYNIMERIVEKFLRGMLSSETKICDCEVCYNKIFVQVLSNIPAKYVTSETGAMYTLMEQIRVEQSSVILKELVQAIKDLEPHPSLGAKD